MQHHPPGHRPDFNTVIPLCEIEQTSSVVAEFVYDRVFLGERQIDGNLLLVAGRERIIFSGVGTEPVNHIFSPPLADMVFRQGPVDHRLMRRAGYNPAVEHGKEAGEGVGIAVMGCCCEQQEMFRLLRNLFRQGVPEHTSALLLGTLVGFCGEMCLIDDHKIPARADRKGADPLGFDVIDGSNDARITIPGVRPRWNTPLKAAEMHRREDLCINLEEEPERILPLLPKVLRADDEDPGCQVTGLQFRNDKSGLDCLTKPDVVGDQHPDPLPLVQGHNYRSQLILCRDDRTLPQAHQRCSPMHHGIPERLNQQAVGGDISDYLRVRRMNSPPLNPFKRCEETMLLCGIAVNTGRTEDVPIDQINSPKAPP